MWDVIVLIPDHCLSIYFAYITVYTAVESNMVCIIYLFSNISNRRMTSKGRRIDTYATSLRHSNVATTLLRRQVAAG